MLETSLKGITERERVELFMQRAGTGTPDTVDSGKIKLNECLGDLCSSLEINTHFQFYIYYVCEKD